MYYILEYVHLKVFSNQLPKNVFIKYIVCFFTLISNMNINIVLFMHFNHMVCAYVNYFVKVKSLN